MNPKTPSVTATQMLRALQRDGWVIVRQVGSHATLRHPNRSGRTVVPMHAGKTLQVGLINSILSDTGLTADDLRRLL